MVNHKFQDSTQLGVAELLELQDWQTAACLHCITRRIAASIAPSLHHQASQRAPAQHEGGSIGSVMPTLKGAQRSGWMANAGGGTRGAHLGTPLAGSAAILRLLLSWVLILLGLRTVCRQLLGGVVAVSRSVAITLHAG
jgi:hypothetical protein